MKTLPPLLACLAALSAATVFGPATNAEPPETATSVTNESPARPTLNLQAIMPFPNVIHGVPGFFGPITPNVYAHYWETGKSPSFPQTWGGNTRSYLHANYVNGAAGMVVNYYNFLDYALNEAWEPDQQSKPDNDYSYVDADGFGAKFHRQPWNPFNIKKSRLPR